MTTILRTRTSQPQSPVGIDWGNPITRGLVSSIDWVGEKTLYDSARQKPIPMGMSYVSGAVPSIVTPYGRAINEPINASETYLYGTDTYETIIRSVTFWVKDNSIATTSKIGLSDGNLSVTFNSGSVGNILYWSNIAGEKRLGLYLSWNNFDISVSNVPNGLHTVSCIITNNRPALLFLNGQLVASSSNLAGYYYKSSIGVVGCNSSTTSSLGIGYVLAKRLWVLPSGSYDTHIAKEASANPWQIFKPEARRVFTGYDSPSYIEPVVPPAAQAITVGYTQFANDFYTHTINVAGGNPALSVPFTGSGEQWFAHGVQAGVVTLTAPLATNTNTFYTHSIGSAPYNITAPFLGSANTYYSSTLSRGTVTVSPNLYTNNNTFSTHTVQPGNVSLSVSYSSSTNSFYSPSISTGLMNLVVPLLASNNQFNATIVSPGGVGVGTTNYNNTSTFYPATLNAKYSISATRLESTSSFTLPSVVAGTVYLSTPVLNNTNQFNAHSLQVGSTLLSPTRLLNSNSFYVLEVTGGEWPYTPSLRFYISESRNNPFEASSRDSIFTSEARNTVVSRLLPDNTNFTPSSRTFEFVPESRGTIIMSEPRTTIVTADSRTTQVVSPPRNT